MKKNRSIIVALILLCQLLGCFAIPPRPKEVPDRCTPGKEYECPSTYGCYGTGTPGIGYCNCFAYYGFVRSAPTKDTLADDPYTCVNNGLPWACGLIVHLALLFGFCLGIWDQIVLATRLKRHGALKNNMASRLLFINFFFNYVANVLVFIVQILNILKLDPEMWMHDNTRSYLFTIMMLYKYTTIMEAVVGWIDVVQKSVSLSKKTSKGLVVVQWLTRLGGTYMTVQCAYMLGTDRKLQYMRFDGQVYKYLVPFILLSAWRLAHLLCPKMDRKSKNYSKAVSIWIITLTMVITICGYYIGMHILLMRTLFIASLGNFPIFATIWWLMWHQLFLGQGWIAYIKRGNKKILDQYEDGKATGGILGLFVSSTNSSTSTIEKSVVQLEDTKTGRKSAMENIDETKEEA